MLVLLLLLNILSHLARFGLRVVLVRVEDMLGDLLLETQKAKLLRGRFGASCRCVRFNVFSSHLASCLHLAFLDRLETDPERGAVTEMTNKLLQLADKEEESVLGRRSTDMDAHISWNKFVGAGRCHWLCLELRRGVSRSC